jgi:hypothetical protein
VLYLLLQMLLQQLNIWLSLVEHLVAQTKVATGMLAVAVVLVDTVLQPVFLLQRERHIQ